MSNEEKTFLFPNFDNNEWIEKYNNKVLEIKNSAIDRAEVKSDERPSLHHIIPRSIAPCLTNNKKNFIYCSFQEHMDFHYYLWKADHKYGRQLWFGCVYGRKHGLWDLPGGESEYAELKESLKKVKQVEQDD